MQRGYTTQYNTLYCTKRLAIKEYVIVDAFESCDYNKPATLHVFHLKNEQNTMK